MNRSKALCAIILTFASNYGVAAQDLSHFADPDYGISISYPSHWLLEDTVEDGEVFTVNVDQTVNGGRCVIFVEEVPEFDGMDDAEAADYLLATDWYENRYKVWFPSFTTIARERVELSGRQAVEIEYRTDLVDIGLPYLSESIDYVVAHDGRLTALGCFAGPEEFADLRHVFVATLRSVTLPSD
jgi:hypothetical protein